MPAFTAAREPAAAASASRSFSSHGAVVEAGILRAVAYADVFDYPLDAGEVHRYLVGVRASREEVEAGLRRLVPAYLGEDDGYYFLPGRDALVGVRCRRAAEAARRWPLAVAWGRALARLPFLRMVAVTGSLACDNVDGAGDIDYLIVAEHGRVWVCRAAVGLYSRAVRRTGVELCANYYLSDRALGLPQRDIYTAHELVQMVPVVGSAVYRRLRRENGWAGEWFPNAQGRPPRRVPRCPAPGLARTLAEWALRTPPGAWLDTLERVRKHRKMRRLGLDFSEARFERHCFKGHFDGHARRALAAYAERLQALALDHGGGNGAGPAAQPPCWPEGSGGPRTR